MKNVFKGEPYYYFLMGLSFIFIFSTVLGIVLYFTTHFEKTIQVKEKYVQGRRRGGYFVVDTDNNVYKLVDTWFIGEFNRASDYAKLTTGSSHKVKGYGVRIPVIGQFPRIYNVQ